MAQSPPRLGRPYRYRGEGTGRWQILAWGTGRLISRFLSLILFRLHVRGQAAIPRKGGVLMVTNHQSMLDPWLIGIALSRQVHYMARDTLFRGGVLQYLGELWNAFPVRRGTADLAAIRMAVERLDKGFVLNIFPEGTRSEDGSIRALSPGMILILKRCKTPVPIVPVVIDGAFDAWPRDAKFPRPHAIRIVYGQAIEAREWRQWSPPELARHVREALVKLQREMGSAHAQESARRLAEEATEGAKHGDQVTR